MHSWVRVTLVAAALALLQHGQGLVAPPTHPSLRCSAHRMSKQEQLQIEGISTKGVQIASIGGLRGVIATESLSSKTPVVEVNSELVLEVTSTRQPTPFPEFCPPSLWESLKWDERLAFKLLHLKHVSEASPLMPWIRRLPSTFSTPLTWSDKDIDDLQYPPLIEKIKAQKDKWRNLYELWSKATSMNFKDKVPYSEMVWALQCVNSRAFSGPYEGSTASERRALIAFTGFLTAVWPVLGLGTLEQALSAAFIVTLSIFLRDVISLRASSLKRYVICPYVDMFNHKSDCVSDASYNYFTGQFQLFTGDYQPGNQVFVSFGKQSNDRLFQYYGFIEPDNPHDIYEFNCGFVELIFKYADELSTIISFPAQPDPKTRLEYVSTALRKTVIQNADDPNSLRSSMSASDFKSRIFRTPPSSALTISKKCSYDDVTIRSLRAFLSSESEWKALAPGLTESLKGLEQPLSLETEKNIEKALAAIASLELSSMTTSLEKDLELLKGLNSSPEAPSKGFSKDQNRESRKGPTDATTVDPSGSFRDRDFSKIAFRLEKKKLLQSALDIVNK